MKNRVVSAACLAHRGALSWRHVPWLRAQPALCAHCRVMSCRTGARAWSLVCHTCHVRPRLEHFPREASGADPGDPDLSRSFSLGLTCSQTSPSTPNSQAEDPIPGQAQLQAALPINDC